MTIEKSEVREDFGRDLFWATIFFSDNEKKSKILVAASEEYLKGSRELLDSKMFTKEILDGWLESVLSKWIKLGPKIFDRAVHYDVYSNTQEGEANGIEFLVNKTNNL